MTHLARSRRQRQSVLAAVLVAALTTPGCMAPEDDESVVVDEASHALAASLDLVGISDSFEVSEALALVPVSLARARILLDVRAALLASVANRLCVNVEIVDSATETSVVVTYDDCPAGLLRLIELDGSLRARLELETAPCGTTECPTAVRFTLSTDYLRIGSRFGTFFTEMEGEWSLYDPLAPGLPTEWDSRYAVRNHLEHSLALRSRASWLVEGLCVTLDVDADFQVTQREDLRTIAASARDVRQCLGACPSAGEVQIAYGRGKILTWAYTGMDTALVTGPRGRRFEVALPCGDE
jgi:hypothetical protein